MSQEGTKEGGLKISQTQFDRIEAALAKADRAKEIDPFADIPEAAVIEEDPNE